MTVTLQTLLSEATFETYFVQVVIKIRSDINFTEIYNQIRGIKNVVVVRVIENEKLDAVSVGDYHYSLLGVKFISETTEIEDIKVIKHEALKLPGLVKFYVRTQTLNKIRNY